MIPAKLAFVDVETTGGHSLHDRVIEIGVIRVENNKIVRTLSTLINPDTHIPEFIQQMTGINSKDVESAPSFYHVKDKLSEILDDAVFVAHNVRFDYGFLRNEFRRVEIPFTSKHLCTVKLSRFLYPDFVRHDLDSIISRFSFDCTNRHRALDDAMVLWQFYQKIHTDFDQAQLKKAFQFVLKRPSIPTSLTKTVDNLPENPGVYIFRGEKDIPLYIGKSLNIRDRVLSHFSNDYSSPTDMKISHEAKKIEVIETIGEVGALLMEAQLVKELQPIYNRRLRTVKRLLALVKKTDRSGYETASFEYLDTISSQNTHDILGIFRTKAQAKEYLGNIIKEHNLCAKLMGLEKTNGACFGYQLETCNGSCIGKEKPIKYNLRFIKAFANTRLKSWPFEKLLAIEEENPYTKAKEVFVFNHWCLVKHHSLDKYDNLKETNTEDKTLCFDLDTYKILCRFIFKNKKRPYQKMYFLDSLSNSDTFNPIN